VAKKKHGLENFGTAENKLKTAAAYIGEVAKASSGSIIL